MERNWHSDDNDGDGIDNSTEELWGTDPDDPNTDDDELTDCQEWFVERTRSCPIRSSLILPKRKTAICCWVGIP